MQLSKLIRVLIIVFSLAATNVYGQTATWVLQEIDLKDTFLIQEIEKLIVSMEQKDENFAKGLGYIEVFEKLVVEDNIFREYYVIPSMMTIRASNRKPQFYTWIKERPVFIYLHSFNDLALSKMSKRSFKILTRILNKFLLPLIKGKARDEDGNVSFKVKDLREEYFFIGNGYGFILSYDINGIPSVDFNTHYPVQDDNGM